MALIFTWALFWRWIIAGIIQGIIFGVVVQTAELQGLVILLLQMLVLPLLGLFLSVKWLLGGGRFGSIKIIFMKQAHYQECCKEEALTSNKPMQSTADSLAD